jgi:uncharacterized membrane protein YebE (DUF533 family)
MDTRELVDQLLASGTETLSKGQAYVETQLGLPTTGPERDNALSNMGKGAAAAGVAALLLGTRVGRAVTGGAVKVGGLAAIGGMAYSAYQNWKGTAAETATIEGKTIDHIAGVAAHGRSRSLLKAMIGAAKSDGHIDEHEQAKLDALLGKLELDEDTLQFVKEEIARPLDIGDIAAGADSPAAAAEIYLTSLTVIDPDDDAERNYLNDLAIALNLAPELVAELEAQQQAA